MTRIIDGPRLAAGLLALACLTLVLASGLRTLAPIAPVAPLPPRMDAQPDLERLRTLFGSGQVATTVNTVSASDLNIRLVGVIVDGGHSLALIAVNGQPARPMPIGSRLGAGARIAAVATDNITIEHDDGRKSVLRVPPRTSPGAPPPPSRGTPTASQRPNGAARR